MSHGQENPSSRTLYRAAESVLETLPPAYSVHCTYCGKSFPLRARLTQAIHIRCAGCGKLFEAQYAGRPATESPEVPEKLGPQPTPTNSRRRSASAAKKRIALASGFAAIAFILGLLWPSLFPSGSRHQWDVEVGLNGGKKATFALYGSGEDRIDFVYSSFDGGPFSTDSTWSCNRDEARMLSADEGKGGFPMGVGFSRAGVPWEIRFAGEGRARVDCSGKVLSGSVVRSTVGP